MSGFVRSSEEVERIRSRFSENQFSDVQRVSIEFLTRPSFVERVLPPGLEPTDEPLVQADVVTVGRSNCVGPFSGGGVYIRAESQERVGNYCLAMPMSTDAAITWGRELFGEPKKKATVSLDRDADAVTGCISRYGKTILEINAEMAIEEEPNLDSRTVFHYKCLPDVTGEGFQFDPTLVAVTFEGNFHQYETGTGSISLNSTEHDPFGEIEIEEVLGTSYSITDISSSQENLMTVDSDAFLPYAFGKGRVDDWLALDNTVSSTGHSDS